MEHDTDSILGQRHIRHYYGDYIRQLFIIEVLLSFLSIPVWGDLLPFGIAAQIVGGLLFVLLAGLTNPHGKLVMVANALASGIGALLLEVTAITSFHHQPIDLFFAREAGALLLTLAFYLSVRSARAMFQHKVGEMERPWEFESSREKREGKTEASAES